MYEKILQKLKTQRGENSSVTDKSLEDLARTLEKVITTEEALESADFTPAIKSIDGNINKKASDAVKTAQQKADEEAAEKKRLADEEAEKRRKEKEVDDNGEIPAWAKTLMKQNEALQEQNKKLQTQFDRRSAEEIKADRLNLIKGKLKDLPEYYTTPIVSGFDSMQFENEDAFNSYLERVGKSGEEFAQQAKEHGLPSSTPKPAQQPDKTGQTGELKDAMKMVKEEKEKLEQKS